MHKILKFRNFPAEMAGGSLPCVRRIDILWRQM